MSPGPGTVRQTAGLGVQDREVHLTDKHNSPLVQLPYSRTAAVCSGYTIQSDLFTLVTRTVLWRTDINCMC